MDFAEFPITIIPSGERITISFVTNGVPELEQSKLPFRPEDIVDLRQQMEFAAQNAWSQGASDADELTPNPVRELLRKRGCELMNALFSGRAQKAFIDFYRREKTQNGRNVRIRLNIDSSLAIYPFELLFCEESNLNCHLGLFPSVSLVRSIQGHRTDLPASIEPPLRILLVGTRPRGFPVLKVEQELKQLHEALDLPGIEIETITGRNTRQQLQNRNGQTFHILHFMGHGDVLEADGSGRLIFEGADGSGQPMSGQDLRQLFTGLSGLRLVTINACLSNQGNPADLYSAVAISAFLLDIPAVVAMQNKLTDPAALVFSRQFYRELALGRPVDYAMTMARVALQHSCVDALEWPTPVLYLSASTGGLFDLVLSAGDLAQYARRQLENGDWAAAKDITDVILQRYAGNRAVTEDAERIGAVADYGQQIEEHLAVLSADPEIYGSEEMDDLLKGAVELAANFMPELEALRLQESEVYQIGQAIRHAYDENDLIGALKDCEALPNVRQFSLPHLRNCIQQEQSLQQQMHEIAEFWGDSKWLLLVRQAWKHKEQNSLPASKGNADTIQRGISKDGEGRVLSYRARASSPHPSSRREIVGNLLQARNLLVQGQFKQASDLMEIVPEMAAPANLAPARVAVAIGCEVVRMREEKHVEGDQESFTDLKERLSTLSPPNVEPAPYLQIVLDLFKSQLQEANYQEAVRLYEQNYFTAALKLFETLGSYQDVMLRKAWCTNLLEVRSLIRKGDFRIARGKFKGLTGVDDGGRIKAWKQWCAIGERTLRALKVMATGKQIRDPSLPWEGGFCAYEVLGSLGMTPGSSIKEADRVGGEAMARPGGMTRAERDAWDVLRLSEKRLALDFTVYSVQVPERAGALLERLTVLEEGDDYPMSVAEIVAALEEDGGIFYVLTNNYYEARQFFLNVAAAQPENSVNLHHLGMAAAGHIRWFEERPSDEVEELEEAWSDLIIGFGAVFAQDQFWRQWWTVRRGIYQIGLTDEEIQKNRIRLQRFWLDRIRSATDVGLHLDTLFLIELNAARTVEGEGGIPFGSEGEKRCVLGPLGAERFDLMDALREWAAGFGEQAYREEGGKQQLGRYFSELGVATAYAAEKRWNETVDALAARSCTLQQKVDARCRYQKLPPAMPHLACSVCPDFAKRNPAYAGHEHGAALLMQNGKEILQQAHCSLALEAVSRSPAYIEGALLSWKTALEIARHGSGEEDLLKQIREVAIGRAEFLCKQEGTETLERINSAVLLLTEVLEHGWDDSQATVRMALADALVVRAIHFTHEYDDEEAARGDAMQALKLAPQSLFALIIFCQTSLFYARDLYLQGKSAHTEALIDEIKKYLEEAEAHYVDNAYLKDCRKNLQFLQTLIDDRIPITSALSGVMTFIPPVQEAQQETRLRQWVVEATVKESQEQYAEAIELHKKILELDPENATVLQKMPWCYRAWIFKMLEKPDVSLEETKSVVQEALQRFPASYALEDISLDLFEEEATDG